MRIKIVYDNQTGQTWAIRLVQKRDGYGISDQVIHKLDVTLVEFFDTRHPHTDLGQFVARYGAPTLLERLESNELSLDLGIPSWTVSAGAMDQIREWLQQHVPVAA